MYVCVCVKSFRRVDVANIAVMYRCDRLPADDVSRNSNIKPACLTCMRIYYCKHTPCVAERVRKRERVSKGRSGAE